MLFVLSLFNIWRRSNTYYISCTHLEGITYICYYMSSRAHIISHMLYLYSGLYLSTEKVSVRTIRNEIFIICLSYMRKVTTSRIGTLSTFKSQVHISKCSAILCSTKPRYDIPASCPTGPCFNILPDCQIFRLRFVVSVLSHFI